VKRIGIIGGASNQATAEYYRLLNAEVNRRLGGWNTAEVLVSSMNFALAERWVRTGDWAAAGEDLAARAEALEHGGCALFLCASNTLHRVADRFTAGRSIPFLHVADPTGEAIRARGLRRVALLGTRPVMATDFLQRRFKERFGIDILVPDAAARDDVDRIIFDELCHGRFEAAAKARYLEIVDALAADGAEGVILGCTEIPLLIQQADRPDLPFLDTVALHVQAAVDLALG
jgi:aspartate racemase